MGQRAGAPSARRAHPHGRSVGELVGGPADSAQLEPVRLRAPAARGPHTRYLASAQWRQHADLDRLAHELERERPSVGPSHCEQTAGSTGNLLWIFIAVVVALVVGYVAHR